MSKQDHIKNIAEWVVGLKTDHVSRDVIHIAKRILLDTIGVVCAGKKHQITGRLLQALSQKLDGRAACTVVGGSKANSQDASLINGTAAHVWDYDDVSYAGILHGSAVILPAVLAIAEEKGASDEKILLSLIAASEVTYLLGEVSGYGHYEAGWWSTGTLATIGATVGTAKLLGLNEQQTANAISLAVCRAGIPRAVVGTSAKPLLCGHSAKVGIELAFFASLDIQGPANILERKNGFFDLFKPDQPRLEILSTLGVKWRLQEPGILTKRYPVCSAALAGAEQICQLKHKHKLKYKDINFVYVEVSELVALSLGSFDDPQTARECQFSIPFITACGLYYGDLKLEHLTLETLKKNEIRTLMAKVSWSVNPEFSKKEFSTNAPECYSICVTMSDGYELSGFLGIASEMTDSQIVDKFFSCVKFSNANFEHAEKAVQILSEKRNIKQNHSILNTVQNLF
tara:strand:+ start:341 stop:1711 length:1371 start_codon:yes stop_codon:yes gene_type:complete